MTGDRDGDVLSCKGMMNTEPDGIHAMVPDAKMCKGAHKLRAAYERKPGAPFYQREIGYYCLEQWKEQGMPENVPLAELFGFDPPGKHMLGGLGGCEAEMCPKFDETVVENRGEYEVVRDAVGRHVLCFKGRRNGFMPQYLDHPVKNKKTWEENCKWRLNPDTPERCVNIEEKSNQARAEAGQGMMITQYGVGGYMYLRSLIGPEDLLYKFYDDPELIHDCMQTWFILADKTIGHYQAQVTLDELFLDEDVCYNHGQLISPEMLKEFLFPYYQQLISNIRSRQLDRNRHLYIQFDTDGFANPVIPLYQEIGMDVMSPFEVASGCDVVEIGQQYPDLIISGGVDKRELAKGKAAINRLVDRIFPVMQQRGGYIPTCDHGVPAEVRYQDYLYYRKRSLEFT